MRLAAYMSMCARSVKALMAVWFKPESDALFFWENNGVLRWKHVHPL